MGRPRYPTRHGSRPPPIAAAATVYGFGYGSASCKPSPLNSISPSRLPLGTGKWNKNRHRLFSFINWRAPPLVSYQTIVN